MRKKLMYYLSALFLLFALGVGLSMANTYLISRDIKSVISLHRVEIVRQNLVINTQTVQGNLYTTGTTFGKELDVIVENVLALEESSNNCLTCHHNREVTERLNKIVKTVDQYKRAISQLITTTANEKRIERLKMVAIGIGDTLLSKTQEMAFMADQRLNAKTMGALNKINNSIFILFATVIMAFLIGVLLAVKLTAMITRPINELLNATGIIAEGNLGYEIGYTDRTEFGKLAGNFNAMSKALKEGYDNIYKQQQQIRESERKFRILSEFTSDWEYWINENGEIVFMPASSCERISGYSQEEFIADPKLISDIVHPEDRDLYDRQESGSAQEREETEFRIVAKNGQVRWLSHMRRPIYVEDKFLGYRVSNRDITDRKILEEQLLQSRKMESLGLMAGGVAHDFNNLLTVISGYGSILEQQLRGADEKTVRSVKKMLIASEKAQELTSSLLAFSRKKIMKPATLRLNDVILNNLALLKSLVEDDIELVVSCSEDEFPIFADIHQMEQVLMNLVTNARDAMPEGGKLAIGTTPLILNQDFTGRYGARPGKYMMLSVSDIGAGIDRKDIPYIFEPFFTTKEKTKGTGLGLSMVYGIIKQHGGFIDVYSEKGFGTTFKVYQPASAETESVEQAPAAVEVVAVDFRGDETILIAEDEPAVRDFFRDILESYGYRIILAVDGMDAVKKFNKHKEIIDMIILDVVMPRKNGKEAYNQIKEVSPGIKTLFMSGYTHDILTSRGVCEEGLEFVSKPLDTDKLLTKIRTILNG